MLKSHLCNGLLLLVVLAALALGLFGVFHPLFGLGYCAGIIITAGVLVGLLTSKEVD